MADFDAVIDDLNLIHPEFILHTGDLVNEGELEEYLGMYEMGRAQADARPPGSEPGVRHHRQPRHRRLGTDAAAGRHLAQELVAVFRLAVPGQPAGRRSRTTRRTTASTTACCTRSGLESYINNGSYDSYQPAIWRRRA